MSASVAPDYPSTSISPAEAPLTLAEPPPQTLGLRDTFGLWANLGVSLLLPVAAAFVVLPGRSLGMSVLAVVVGAVIGSVLLGLTAAPAARERVPAMVLLRGLLGRRVSYLPTVLNVVQCVGWATFEIVIIAEAASRALSAPRWPFVLAAGVLATVMAVRPLGAMRVLGRYAVWASLAATIYLFVRVLGEPPRPMSHGGAVSFWSAVDVVIALPVSWFPLAGDYTRHSRTARTAFVGSAAGYGVSTVAFFTLGILALAAYGKGGLDVIGALLAVPIGVLAVLVLVALIGAVFVPLAAVLVVAYYLMPRGPWDVSDAAPARISLVVPWAAGFVAYQLTLPTYFDGVGAGWTSWWASRQADLGIPADNGWSASLVSLAVASLLTAAVALPAALRARRGSA
jgi:purine-cytosine permease-like protein